MKAALILVLLCVVLCALISQRLVSFSMLYDNLVMLSSTRIFRYSVFNSIIVVILARSFRSSAGGVNELLPLAQLLRGELEEQTEELKYASEDSNEHSDDDDSHCGSSGYEDDNDDNTSDCEIEDDKESADNNLADQETEHDLENKAEAFISKVIQGWKKELMMDKLWNI